MKRIAVRTIALMAALLLMRAAASAQQPAPPQRIAGIINIEWGDPHPDLNAGGIAVAWLERLDPRGTPPEFAGRGRILLQLNGQEALAANLQQKAVELTGRAIANPIAAARANEPFVFDVETKIGRAHV